MAPMLRGRAFYESLGAPKYVLAPMVDQSEFAWRLLTRSFLPPDMRSSILCYSPMLHAKLFAEKPGYRKSHFEALRPPFVLPTPGGYTAHDQTRTEKDLYLDGNPAVGDRPLFVQFCANDPSTLLDAAKLVQPFCDAVDLNLGCPQGIAKRGHYGAYLQEDWETIHKLISTLHRELNIPVTAKMRILETREKTLEYAKMILDAGASIITVHGRQREQKGHNTGLADWSTIRYLRENLPPETVIFANGNILRHDDLQRCLDETKADAVMSAEGNLYDPSIFADPPADGQREREYWTGNDGKGGYRIDAVLRRYLDILHEFVTEKKPPERLPLFLPSDVHEQSPTQDIDQSAEHANSELPPAKRQKLEALFERDNVTPQQLQKQQQKSKQVQNKKQERSNNPNLIATQAHCFHIMRPLVARHHHVRDALAKCRAGDLDALERVLALVQQVVKEGLMEYEKNPEAWKNENRDGRDLKGYDKGKVCDETERSAVEDPSESSDAAVRRCKRPWWICQPYVRPLPKEALERGSLQLSKKEKKRLSMHEGQADGAESTARVVGYDAKPEHEKSADAHIPKQGLCTLLQLPTAPWSRGKVSSLLSEK